MKGSLSLIAIALGLFVAGAGGTWLYLRSNRPAPAVTETTGHGRTVAIPENPTLCAAHGIPAVVCPFCDPGLVEELGHCGGHDVPEALCTRCNPVLIAAFKAEGDWCAEHGLPESQCLICRGGEG